MKHGGQAELYATMAILAGLSIPSYAASRRESNSENPKGHRARKMAKKKHQKSVEKRKRRERKRK